MACLYPAPHRHLPRRPRFLLRPEVERRATTHGAPLKGCGGLCPVRAFVPRRGASTQARDDQPHIWQPATTGLAVSSSGRDFEGLPPYRGGCCSKRTSHRRVAAVFRVAPLTMCSLAAQERARGFASVALEVGAIPVTLPTLSAPESQVCLEPRALLGETNKKHTHTARAVDNRCRQTPVIAVLCLWCTRTRTSDVISGARFTASPHCLKSSKSLMESVASFTIRGGSHLCVGTRATAPPS